MKAKTENILHINLHPTDFLTKLIYTIYTSYSQARTHNHTSPRATHTNQTYMTP